MDIDTNSTLEKPNNVVVTQTIFAKSFLIVFNGQTSNVGRNTSVHSIRYVWSCFRSYNFQTDSNTSTKHMKTILIMQ